VVEGAEVVSKLVQLLLDGVAMPPEQSQATPVR